MDELEDRGADGELAPRMRGADGEETDDINALFDPVVDPENFAEDTDGEDGVEDDTEVSFRHCLDTPPVHHIIDNGVAGLSDVMPSWDSCIEGAKETCRVFRGRDTKPKIKELCLWQPGRERARPIVDRFNAKNYPGRFGSIVFAIPLLMGIQNLARWYYSLQAMQAGMATAKEETQKRFVVVDQFIGSAFNWAWFRIIEVLAFF